VPDPGLGVVYSLKPWPFTVSRILKKHSGLPGWFYTSTECWDERGERRETDVRKPETRWCARGGNKGEACAHSTSTLPDYGTLLVFRDWYIVLGSLHA
jgi:hypothetical protein